MKYCTSLAALASAFAVLGQHAAGSADPAVVCPGQGDFRVGSMVQHRTRGVARVACQVGEDQPRPGVIGVCQGMNSGHNKFSHCFGASKGVHPPFCSEKALWFVRCEDIKGISDDMAGLVNNSNTPTTTADCGCSWNFRSHCEVSGQQALDAMTDPSTVRSWCPEDRDTPECQMAGYIAKTAERFRHCLTLGATDCRRDRQCQWAAQGSGQCGFDEEKFMLQLAGPEASNHPLLRMIMLHDHCNQLGDEQCDGDPVCQLQDSSTGACDVKPSLTASVMIANPRLVLEWEGSSAEAYCHAQSISRHTSGGQTRCVGPCISVQGICRVDPKKMRHPQLQSMMNQLCMQAFASEKGRGPDSCPHPCVFHGGSSPCSGPPVTESMLRSEVERADSRVVMTLLKLIQSSQYPYAEHCEKMQEFQCKVAKPTCDSEPVWTRDSSKSSEAALPTVGFKGTLKDAAQAVAQGKGREFMEDFLTNHPDKVKDMTKTLADRIKTLWEPATTTPAIQVEASSTPGAVSQSVPNVPAGVSCGSHTVAQCSDCGRMWCHGDCIWFQGQCILAAPIQVNRGQQIVEMVTNPWVLAGGTALVAAVCSGIAFGVLCHARLTWRQRRREMGGALLEADCDMTTFSGHDADYIGVDA